MSVIIEILTSKSLNQFYFFKNFDSDKFLIAPAMENDLGDLRVGYRDKQDNGSPEQSKLILIRLCSYIYIYI